MIQDYLSYAEQDCLNVIGETILYTHQHPSFLLRFDNLVILEILLVFCLIIFVEADPAAMFHVLPEIPDLPQLA